MAFSDDSQKKPKLMTKCQVSQVQHGPRMEGAAEGSPLRSKELEHDIGA